MTGTCEVCSSQPSKYRCPTCGLMSCSLACTQSHTIYCAPKAIPSHGEPVDSSAAASRPVQNDANAQSPADEKHEKSQAPTPASVAASPAVRDLLLRYPQLRSQLQDIYRATLEEEWVEWHTPAPRDRHAARGGKALSRRRSGPWTAEKGFNRGLGKVRKLRQQCEEGLETGLVAEAFMQFLALINDGYEAQSRDSS